MEISTERQLKALQVINEALTKGLQMAIVVLEDPDKYTEEQRNFIIAKMNKLVEGSQPGWPPKIPHLWPLQNTPPKIASKCRF